MTTFIAAPIVSHKLMDYVANKSVEQFNKKFSHLNEKLIVQMNVD